VINPNATAAQRPITVQRTAGEYTVVEKGLNPGEQVVTDGQLRLTSGSKVQVKAAAGSDQQRSG
jgi:multidrug efflux system membrane fusion protein